MKIINNRKECVAYLGRLGFGTRWRFPECRAEYLTKCAKILHQAGKRYPYKIKFFKCGKKGAASGEHTKGFFAVHALSEYGLSIEHRPVVSKKFVHTHEFDRREPQPRFEEVET